MIDFWVSSGHLLLDKDQHGRLVPTDEFIKLYLARPELLPPEEACDAERDLHALMMANPRADIGPESIARLADADARENWAVMLDFRDQMLAHGTLEAGYLALMRKGVGQTPPLFISQLVHVIMRNVLDGVEDPITLRAGELMFRSQRLTQEQGGMLMADQEIVDGAQEELHRSPLSAMMGEQKARTLDVLKTESADLYWKRSDQFDMVLDFAPKARGRAALAGVLERWIGHMLGLEAKITPLERIEDSDWFWFVGLDQESTRTGNQLWRGERPAPGSLERIVALFDMRLPELREIAARPIYLILSMTAGKIVTLKPQNLLLGLPDAAYGGRHGAA